MHDGCLASAFEGCRFNIGRQQQGQTACEEGGAVHFLPPLDLLLGKADLST
jgi:hypothetical protein